MGEPRSRKKRVLLGQSLETPMLPYRWREEEGEFARCTDGKGTQVHAKVLLGVVGSRGAKAGLAGRQDHY